MSNVPTQTEKIKAASHGFRTGSRVVTEDGAHGTVSYVVRGIATVYFDQSETWGSTIGDVSVDDLYREQGNPTGKSKPFVRH